MSVVGKRDEDVLVVDENGNLVHSWYYSDQASAIKYGVLFGILVLGFIMIFSSWFHARSRLKKGLAPLAYHRWLVPRHHRAQFEPHLRDPERSFSFYGRQPQQQQDYGMHAVPPPVYNPNLRQPPAYPGAPPATPTPAAAMTAGGGGGGSKIDPFQDPTPPARAPGAGGEGSSHMMPMAPALAQAAPGRPPHPPRYS